MSTATAAANLLTPEQLAANAAAAEAKAAEVKALNERLARGEVVNQASMLDRALKLRDCIDANKDSSLDKAVRFVYDQSTDGSYIFDADAALKRIDDYAASMKAAITYAIALRDAPGIRGVFNEHNLNARMVGSALLGVDKGNVTHVRKALKA